MSLEKIAESLGEQLPTKLEESLTERKKRIEKWGVVALSIFGVGVLSLPLYQVVKALLEGRTLAGLGLLGLIIILGCGLLSVILFAKANEVEKAKSKRSADQPEELLGKATTAKLLPEADQQPIPSITDRTTELLYAENKGTAKES